MDAVSFEESIRKWLDDIFEEKPLPFEINYLYFLLIEDQNTYHLEFVGSENFSLYDFEYQPKCAEFFIYAYNESINEFKLKIKYLLNKLNKEKILNKKIKLILYLKNKTQFIK